MQALPHCSEILSETLGLSFPFMPLWHSQGAKRPARALFPLPLSPLPQINLAPKAEASGDTEEGESRDDSTLGRDPRGQRCP